MSDCAAEENSERSAISNSVIWSTLLRLLAPERKLGRENQGNNPDNYILDEQRPEDMSRVVNRALQNRSFLKRITLQINN
jgi:hypothetical protein